MTKAQHWKFYAKPLIIILVLISLPIAILLAARGSANNISRDLVGQKVISTNEKDVWTFSQGEPLKYTILKQRFSGSNKNKTLYYTLFVETRHFPNAAGMKRAGGIIELRYSSSLMNNEMILSSVTPVDFKVMPMSTEDMKLLEELDMFWEEFQIAVVNNYREKVVNSIEYPFTGKFFGQIADKYELQKNYDKIFAEDVRGGIQNSMLTPITKPKGKPFIIDKDEYIQQIDFNFNIEKDGFNYFLVVKRIGNQFKIVRFQEFL
jgi:hypothetical protein